MYGVPGFESSQSREDFAFDHLSEDEAIEISEVWFGVHAERADRLHTERDDSFRLQTRHGERVLKVAHPADSAMDIERQLRAAEHVAKFDHSIPVQRIVKTQESGLWLELPSGRVARMLHWLPGELLLNVPAGSVQLAALGDAFGRVTRALGSFVDDGVAPPSAWNLQTVPRLTTLLAEYPNDAVAEAITRFTKRVVPLVDQLPVQFIHNDFNPGNVLVDRTDPRFVVGILDFGDAVRSFRVAELAVALSYQLSPLRHNWTNLAPMIEAFTQHVPLNETEVGLLPDLVAARFAQRILIKSWAAQRENHTYNDYDALVASLTALLDLEA